MSFRSERRRTRARLEEAGIEFLGETVNTGVCQMAFLLDPDGTEFLYEALCWF